MKTYFREFRHMNLLFQLYNRPPRRNSGNNKQSRRFQKDNDFLIDVKGVTFSLNNLQHFYTPTWIGSNNHVWFPSPADTRNKLSIIIISLSSRNTIYRAKLVWSDWHRQRSIVSINLEQDMRYQLQKLKKPIIFWLNCTV